jgi:hypothetical protein
VVGTGTCRQVHRIRVGQIVADEGRRGGIGSLPLRVDGNVEPTRPHAHCRSIRGVEPTIQPGCLGFRRGPSTVIDVEKAVGIAAGRRWAWKLTELPISARCCHGTTARATTRCYVEWTGSIPTQVGEATSE